MAFETSASTENLDIALAKAQAKINAAVKNKVNPHFKNKYADLDSLWAACRDALTAEGINLTQWPVHSDDSRLHLVTRLGCKGEWMRSHTSIPVTKHDPQGYGSALTYLRRFGLGAAVNLVTDEDDDGNKASEKEEKPKGKVITPNSPILELAQYVVPFGRQYKGKKLSEVPFEDIKGFINWLEGKPESELDDVGREFLLIATSYFERLSEGQVVNG